MDFASIQMNTGYILEGKRIGGLVEFIVNKFSQEYLSYDEALIVLDQVKLVLGESCIVHNLDGK